MANGILQKGHRAHRSVKLVYVLVALLSVIALIAAIELFLWNRKVSRTLANVNHPSKISSRPSYRAVN